MASGIFRRATQLFLGPADPIGPRLIEEDFFHQRPDFLDRIPIAQARPNQGLEDVRIAGRH